MTPFVSAAVRAFYHATLSQSYHNSTVALAICGIKATFVGLFSRTVVSPTLVVQCTVHSTASKLGVSIYC